MSGKLIKRFDFETIINAMFLTIIFVFLFGIFFSLFNNKDGISQEENRTLSALPKLIDTAGINTDFPVELQAWLSDHITFRDEIIGLNGLIQYYVFGRLDGQDLGPKGELAGIAHYEDYQHTNLKSEAEISDIVTSVGKIAQYLKEKGTDFYYCQCWDKHTVYSEMFSPKINQYGNISKTDQVVNAMIDRTDINVISLKEAMLNGKENGLETYSEWNEQWHWTFRGALIGYQTIMNEINVNHQGKYKVLSDEDFEITIIDQGDTVQGVHVPDYLEYFTLKKVNGEWYEKTSLPFIPEGRTDQNFWGVNHSADNEDVLLVIGDSYIASKGVLYYMRASFSEVIMFNGDVVNNTETFKKLIDTYHPTIVIIENAERVDRYDNLVNIAKDL